MAVIALTQSSNLQTLDVQAENIIEVVANGTGSDVSYYYQGAQSTTVTVTQSPTAIQALAPNIISVTDVSGSMAGVGITATITYNTLVGTFDLGEKLLVDGVFAGYIAADTGSVLTVNNFQSPLPAAAKLSGNDSKATATETGTTTYAYKTSYTRYINAVRILTIGNANLGGVNQIGYFNADNSVVEYIYVSDTLASLVTAINAGTTYVTISGTQTVTGNKTFSGTTVLSGASTLSGATTLSGTTTGISGTLTISGLVLETGVQAISGAGAINVTTKRTDITTTAADAYTLANGTVGQIKKIVMVVDGGDATITPTTLLGFTTITLSAVGQSVVLQYGTGGWAIIGGNGYVAA